MTRNNPGEKRRIADPQPANSVYAQLRIHYTVLFEGCHPAGASGMIYGLHTLLDDFDQLFVSFEMQVVVKVGMLGIVVK